MKEINILLNSAIKATLNLFLAPLFYSTLQSHYTQALTAAAAVDISFSIDVLLALCLPSKCSLHFPFIFRAEGSKEKSKMKHRKVFGKLKMR